MAGKRRGCQWEVVLNGDVCPALARRLPAAAVSARAKCRAPADQSRLRQMANTLSPRIAPTLRGRAARLWLYILDGMNTLTFFNANAPRRGGDGGGFTITDESSIRFASFCALPITVPAIIAFIYSTRFIWSSHFKLT